jgi:hypothetical protein
MMANKPDAANPAMTLWLTIEDQWRRVADLERSVSVDALADFQRCTADSRARRSQSARLYADI